MSVCFGDYKNYGHLFFCVIIKNQGDLFVKDSVSLIVGLGYIFHQGAH